MRIELIKDKWHEHLVRKLIVSFTLVIIAAYGIVAAITVIGIPVAIGALLIGGLLFPFTQSTEKVTCNNCGMDVRVYYPQVSSKCRRCKQNIEIYWIKPNKTKNKTRA